MSDTPGWDAQQAMAARLSAAGIVATADSRSATPPCVLVPPPRRRTSGVNCGFLATWNLVAMAPGVGNADAAVTLDRLVTAVESVLAGTDSTPGSYNPSGNSPPLPAYYIAYEEGV